MLPILLEKSVVHVFLCLQVYGLMYDMAVQGWDAFYPNGSATPYYSLIKVVPDWMEIVSTGRFDIQSGRADWAPPSLERVAVRIGMWVRDVYDQPFLC